MGLIITICLIELGIILISIILTEIVIFIIDECFKTIITTTRKVMVIGSILCTLINICYWTFIYK